MGEADRPRRAEYHRGMDLPVALPAAGLGLALGLVLYLRLFRPWQLRWGATDEEVRRTLPGDEMVERPTFDATRAITIAASPEQIWPWLLQVGVKRAGWYSYDLLDNLARPSAREIIPEFQGTRVGDIIAMSPDGKHGVHVLALDLPRSMLWGTPPDTSWLWFTEPGADGTTRLITRIRMQYRWRSPTIIFSLLVELFDIWMIRRMLLNVRERAEGLAGTPADRVTAQPG